MSNTTTTAPAAGWYPDPANREALRWWDGVQWTTQVQTTAAPPSYQPSPQPSYPPSFQPSFQPIGPTTTEWRTDASFTMAQVGSAQTAGIWLLAVYPILSLVIGGLAQVFGNTLLVLAGLPTAGILFIGLPVSVILAWVFAGIDIRALRRAGYTPPSILWMLLFPPLAYLIARGRAVRRDLGRAWPAELVYFLNVVLVGGLAALSFGILYAALSASGLIGPVGSGQTPGYVAEQGVPEGFGPTTVAGVLPEGDATFSERTTLVLSDYYGYAADPAAGTIDCSKYAHLADYETTQPCLVTDLDVADGVDDSGWITALVELDGTVIFNTSEYEF